MTTEADKLRAARSKMKLYVWEGDGVLQDYTSGMICVLAPNLKTALSAIQKEASYAIGAFPPKPTKTVKIHDRMKPRAWLCWGGG